MDIAKQQTKPMKLPRRKLSSRDWQMITFCAFPLLYVFVFNYLPMVGLIIAFKDYRFSLGMFGSEWIGFKNFEFFFGSDEFLRLIRNTIGMNTVFILVNMVASVALAIVLYDLKSRTATKIYQTVLITPHFLSWVVVSYMLYGFLHPTNGLLNQFLGNALHLKSIDWYSTPNAWPFILAVANLWKHIGMDSVLYYAALMGIDNSLFEAAEIDGAKKWQINVYIIVPCLLSIIVMLLIRSLGNIFRADFGLFYQLPRNIGLLYSTTDVMDTYIFRAMRVIGDMGMSTAAGLLQSIVGFVMVVFVNWVVNKIEPEMALF